MNGPENVWAVYSRLIGGTMDDPYKLPDGPVAIQFSGGRTSGYMLWHILDRYDGKLPSDCHVLFQNTGREMPETLDFVNECQTRWNVQIVWIQYHPTNKHRFETVSHNSAARNGEPFIALLEKREYRAVPTPLARWCTGDLKVKPAEGYLRSLGLKHWHAVLGIRADEARRVKEGGTRTWQNDYPLVRANIAKRDVVEWWKNQEFDLGLPSFNNSTPLGNCDGCFLKSEKNRAWIARKYPERAAWWAEIEARAGKQFNDKNASWAQLIDHAHRQQDWVFEQENDVYCDVGFGGCHD